MYKSYDQSLLDFHIFLLLLLIFSSLPHCGVNSVCEKNILSLLSFVFAKQFVFNLHQYCEECTWVDEVYAVEGEICFMQERSNPAVFNYRSSMTQPVAIA